MDVCAAHFFRHSEISEIFQQIASAAEEQSSVTEENTRNIFIIKTLGGELVEGAAGRREAVAFPSGTCQRSE